MKALLKKFVKDEKGLETVEWAVIAALVVTGLVVTIKALGGHVLEAFEDLDDATTGTVPS